jgi:hypothetical protein
MMRDREAREASKAEARAAIDAATAEFTRGGIDRGEWQRRVSDALGEAYLRWTIRAGNPDSTATQRAGTKRDR